ncbi:MAG: DUF3341 domain-containing protein [Rhodospirillaceae bacterium]
MREPQAHATRFGLIAAFDSPDRLIDAARRAHEAGYRHIDAYSPFPIDAIPPAIGMRDRRVAWLTLAGGIVGAAAGYGMQVYTNLDFPIPIGGRPLLAPPAFMLITFEMLVLFAVLSAIFGMLALNRLPRLNHPVFDVDGFDRATRDRFFLIVFGNDPRFDEAATRGFLETLGPVSVQAVGHTEAPE